MKENVSGFFSEHSVVASDSIIVLAYLLTNDSIKYLVLNF